MDKLVFIVLSFIAITKHKGTDRIISNTGKVSFEIEDGDMCAGAAEELWVILLGYGSMIFFSSPIATRRHVG